MKVTEPHIVVGVLLLMFWLLGFQYWSSANSDLKLHSTRLYNQQRNWWLAVAAIVIVATVGYHIATHGFKPLWL